MGNSAAIELQSTLRCPACGTEKTETMPVNACQWFYECEHCHTLLKPLPGDCCVFCSYGTVACPPVQEAALTGKNPVVARHPENKKIPAQMGCG